MVTFPNTACVTAMGAMGQGAGGEPMLGLCVTSEQCTEDGGEASGNCASGFGVCCFIRLTTHKNNSMITYQKIITFYLQGYRIWIFTHKGWLLH